MLTLQLLQRASFQLIALPVIADTSKATAIATLKAIRWGGHLTINVCEFLLVWLVRLAAIALLFLIRKAKEHGPVVLTYAAKLPSAAALPSMAIDAGVSAGLVIKPWVSAQVERVSNTLRWPLDVLKLAGEVTGG